MNLETWELLSYVVTVVGLPVLVGHHAHHLAALHFCTK